MLRFGNMLKKSHSNQIHIDEVYPKPVLSKFIFTEKIRKWSSYVDKYLLFKTRLRNCLNKPYDLIHIIDQSNAIYLNEIKKYSHILGLVTCHDLIAIRQSKGEFKDANHNSVLYKGTPYLKRKFKGRVCWPIGSLSLPCIAYSLNKKRGRFKN